MSEDKDVISDEEKAALLNGVNDGSVDVDSGVPTKSGDMDVVDFVSQERVVRGELPVLERIHERFSKCFIHSIYSLMARDIEVTLEEIRTEKFKDVIYTLEIPAAINMIRCHPLRGKALIILDNRLVYTLVDNYFGGHSGERENSSEEREFTNAEIRIMELIINSITRDLENSWERQLKMDIEKIGFETNPQLINTANPEDPVIVTEFKVAFSEKSIGKLFILMPYAMLEPIKEQLDMGAARSDDEVDPNWIKGIRTQVYDVPLEIRSILAREKMTLRKIQEMVVGDIIPIDIPETVTLDIEGIPSFVAKFGKSNDKCALKILHKIER